MDGWNTSFRECIGIKSEKMNQNHPLKDMVRENDAMLFSRNS